MRPPKGAPSGQPCYAAPVEPIAIGRFMIGLAAALAMLTLSIEAITNPPDSASHWIALAAFAGLLSLMWAFLVTALGVTAWFVSHSVLEFIAELFGLDPLSRSQGPGSMPSARPFYAAPLRTTAIWRFMLGLAAALAVLSFYRIVTPTTPEESLGWPWAVAVASFVGFLAAFTVTILGVAAWCASCRTLEFIAGLFGPDPSLRERERSPTAGSRLPP